MPQGERIVALPCFFIHGSVAASSAQYDDSFFEKWFLTNAFSLDTCSSTMVVFSAPSHRENKSTKQSQQGTSDQRAYDPDGYQYPLGRIICYPCRAEHIAHLMMGQRRFPPFHREKPEHSTQQAIKPAGDSSIKMSPPPPGDDSSQQRTGQARGDDRQDDGTCWDKQENFLRTFSW